MALDHGLHNEELCDHLQTLDGKYNDWVVTTAFYACIHFVEHKLFPLKQKEKEFQTFDSYCDFQHNENDSNLSKHSLKSELVGKYIPAIKYQYRQLKDACMNSRYTEYKVTGNKAQSCSGIMKVIKRHCV
ncbi:hypothetical protein [Pedobacter rhizosphaerae]|uniref:Uncharacterized protein n=1 Tax=Pedobacter rhizosphaerae TaxID=390241 RepID=A0A1H9TU51_9SPHI|nr:hypothetical protein [Pedobacter rhizosphaerae]SES00293.1 hypothetical protein SAMN04488023_12474 [Pedobacter rhizosphaerae]